MMPSENEPLVTIAIPAFKRHWLSEAIQSALNQDYHKIELIIVDDCSPQNLKEVVSPFLSDSRVRYYKNEKNLGSESIVLNWNRCLEYAKGEYFVLLCDDDMLQPNFVSSLLGLFFAYPASNVSHARKWNLNETGEKIESPLWPEYETGEQFLIQRLSKNRHHTISEFLIKTTALKTLGGYVVFPSGFYSDNASIIQLSQVGGIASSKECLMTFRCSDEHITGSTSPKNCWDKYLAAIAYWNWIFRYSVAKELKQQVWEEVECTVFNSFKYAPLLMKVKMFISIPSDIVSIKQKMGYLTSIILR